MMSTDGTKAIQYRAGADYWKSAGIHLLRRNARGWLEVTPDFIRAYLTRPEIHPIDTSCAREVALFEALMEDPVRNTSDAELSCLADQDAADNYRVVLGFRDALLQAGTIEGAYLALIRGGNLKLPPVFIDQLVHIIMGNLLESCGDPLRLRAGEIFFRQQNVSTDDGRLMLADTEILEMYARPDSTGGLGALLAESGTPARQVELDVIDDDNRSIYWARSDRFDTVVDFRFTQPALDAFCRAMEDWLVHLLGLQTRIAPRASLQDADWRWHIGLDRQANELLNTLYNGNSLEEDQQRKIVALFTMDILDDDRVLEHVRGRAVYLALAMDEKQHVLMKPQNLIMNLPLVTES